MARRLSIRSISTSDTNQYAQLKNLTIGANCLICADFQCVISRAASVTVKLNLSTTIILLNLWDIGNWHRARRASNGFSRMARFVHVCSVLGFATELLSLDN